MTLSKTLSLLKENTKPWPYLLVRGSKKHIMYAGEQQDCPEVILEKEATSFQVMEDGWLILAFVKG